MSHRSALHKIVIDAAPDVHDKELAFWEAASGQPLPPSQRFAEYHGAMLATSSSFGVLVQRLGEGTSRVHVDIHSDDVEAEVARLEKLGAERVEDHERWTVLRDPAGLLFCVVVDHTLHDTNSHVWEP